MEKYIDLHVHTTASDGTMTPSEVVKYAADKGLAAIAITDHDTAAGVPEAVAQGKKSHIEVIAGIELSVSFAGEMHILGYFIDIYSMSFVKQLNQLKFFRDQRNPQIIEKLNKLGIEITMEEVLQKTNGGIVGRPHIAAVLADKGYADNVSEAFMKYLNKGKPAYVEKKKLSPKEGIQSIKEARGLAVLAHPIYLERDGMELEQIVKTLKAYGLDGIEACYPEYSDDVSARYLKLADKYDLIVTGGSDFHGTTKPTLDLGTGYGSLKVPYNFLENMKKKLEEI